MGGALSRVGKIAFMEAVNFLVAGLVGVGNVLLTIFGGVAKEFVTILAAAGKADFWKELQNALKSAAFALTSMILEGVSRVLDALRDVPGIGKKSGSASDKAKALSGEFGQASLEAGGAAVSSLTPLFAQLSTNLRETFKKAGEAFSEGRNSVGDVLDTSGAKTEFMQWLQPIARAADSAVKAAAKSAEKGGLPAPIAGTSGNTDSGASKAKNDVASLQRIGGGGGFSISRADPLLAENRAQTGELKAMRGEIKQLRETIAGRRVASAEPVFG